MNRLLALVILFAASPAWAVQPELVVAEAMAAAHGVPVTDIEVGPLTLPQGMVRDRDWNVELPQWASQLSRVPVVLTAPGSQGPEVARVDASVYVWREVPVAARDTAPGEPIELVMGRVRSDRINGTPVDPSMVWLASGRVVAGQPIVQGRSRAKPDAEAGTSVTVLVQRGEVRLSGPGELLDDAWAGKRVKVRSLITSTQLEGVWRNDGLVVIGDTP